MHARWGGRPPTNRPTRTTPPPNQDDTWDDETNACIIRGRNGGAANGRPACSCSWVGATGGGVHANTVENKIVERSDDDSVDWQPTTTWLGGDKRRADLRRGHPGASIVCSSLLELT